MLNLTTELAGIKNSELVATWNIMQALRRTLGGGQHENEPLVSVELQRRGIAHQTGKRTVAK